MPGVITTQPVEVLVDFDRVVLTIGANPPLQIPYATSFKVAQGIRLAAKNIARMYNVREKWPTLVKNVVCRDWVEGSRKPKRPRAWSVGFNGEDVNIQFDDLTIGMHFADALHVAQWIRAAGRQCKRNVGDTSRQLNAAGILSDAEQNYKTGR